ncbi:MAG: hypothetical protein RR528_08455, partial [Angelakisella sp.]
GYNYCVSDTIPILQNATARFGHAVLIADNQADMKENIRKFYDIFQVSDIHGQPMVRRCYPNY